MNQVLILTKNVLAEQEIQQKLQALNYEVYCSVKLFEQRNQQHVKEIFRFFHYIILSETICEAEVAELIPLLKRSTLQIVRKVETQMTEMDYKYLEDNFVNAIISSRDSTGDLRESLYQLRIQLEEKLFLTESNSSRLVDKVVPFRLSNLERATNSLEEDDQFLNVLHLLSRTEIKVLSILLEAGFQIVTRETICCEVWNDEANNSHLASLSSTVGRIKLKFEQTSLKKTAIQTMWGKGYRINPELLNRIQKNDVFKRLFSN